MRSRRQIRVDGVRSSIKPLWAIRLLAAAAVAALPAGSARAAETLAFGLNQYGEIGNGSPGNPDGTEFFNAPVPVTGLNFGVTALAPGGAHSYAAKNGALYGWGLNQLGQVGNGTSTFNFTTPQPGVVLTSGVTAVQGSLYAGFAIANGTMYSWGGNTDGILSNGTPADGSTSTPAPVVGLGTGPVTAIAASQRHVVAIQSGALYAWGYSTFGQIGNGDRSSFFGDIRPPVTSPFQVPGLSTGVTLATAGGVHTIAVKNNSVFAFGSNAYGQLGIGNDSISGVGNFDAFYATPQAVVGMPSGTVADVSAGNNFSMALVNGAVYTWGRNENGQLGNGTFSLSKVPIAVTGITGTIVDIEAGSTSAYALGADGSLWSWGNNTYGQLGIGSTDTPFETPQHLLPTVGYRFDGLNAGSNSSHVLVTMSALPVYYTGAAGNSLNDVANFAANLAGTTPAPIATVESTDVFFGASTATPARLATATVTTAMNANSLTFGTGAPVGTPVTVGGPGTITLYADKNTYAAGTGVVVQPGAGAVTINAPVAIAAPQTWTNGSPSALTVAGGVALGSSTLTVGGTGPTSLTGPLTGTGSLAKTGTGTLRVTSPTYTALLGGTGGLDVRAGRVVLDYADAANPLAMVKSILTAGYAQATRFSAGQIRGTTLAAGQTIGYGQTAGSTVTVRVTLPGDANLDGAVTFDDFALLQTSFGQNNVTFAQGDFNYSNTVDFNDFALLQTNFGQSLPGGRAVFSREQYAAILSITNASQVPEPAALAALAAGGVVLMRRRASKR